MENQLEKTTPAESGERLPNPTVLKIDRALKKIGYALAFVAGLVILLFIFMLTADIFTSKIFHRNIKYTTEIVTYFHVIVVFFPFMIVTLLERHTTVDILTGKFSTRVQKILTQVWHVVGLAFCVYLTVISFQFALGKFNVNERSGFTEGLYIWPFAASMCLGWATMGLSYLWCIIRSFFGVEVSADEKKI